MKLAATALLILLTAAACGNNPTVDTTATDIDTTKPTITAPTPTTTATTTAPTTTTQAPKDSRKEIQQAIDEHYNKFDATYAELAKAYGDTPNRTVEDTTIEACKFKDTDGRPPENEVSMVIVLLGPTLTATGHDPIGYVNDIIRMHKTVISTGACD